MSNEQDFKVYGIPKLTMRNAKNGTYLILFLLLCSINQHRTIVRYAGWLIIPDVGFQNWTTFSGGTFADNGGNIRFKHAGVYQLVAQVTDPTGRVICI